MQFNLITDSWIPVIRKNGERVVVAPHEIADVDVLRPDWPRPDMNIACLEFLIGLVFLADPPADLDDWEDREVPDMGRFREALTPYAPAFNMTGPGPKFMQDLEELSEDPKSVDTLFIDSAGGQTIKHNKDLMVARDREKTLDLPNAAMALFTMQVFAPVGGAGIRAGLRGGGPLTTLADPGTGLWDLVWANVPYGIPGHIDDLPWMRETRASSKGSSTEETILESKNRISPEMFFSMPRRINLVMDDGMVTGVRQRRYGTNYTTAIHPLTSYYLDKKDNLLPSHPNSTRLGYENWIGTVLSNPEGGEIASCLRSYGERRRRGSVDVIMAGWNMANASAVDFVESRPVLHSLDAERELFLRGMIAAAKSVADRLGKTLSAASRRKAYSDSAERLYGQTENVMTTLYRDLSEGRDQSTIGADWHCALMAEALEIFDAETLPVMDSLQVEEIEKVVKSRQSLLSLFGAREKAAKELRAKLKLPEKEPEDHVDA